MRWWNWQSLHAVASVLHGLLHCAYGVVVGMLVVTDGYGGVGVSSGAVHYSALTVDDILCKENARVSIFGVSVV